jgi:replicative DNA helicase
MRRLQASIREALEGQGSAEELASALIGTCTAHLEQRHDSGTVTATEAFKQLYDDYFSDKVTQKISTGFPRLDGIIKGIAPGELCIIGARPGVGKSAFSLDVLRTAVKSGKKSILYSYEMSRSEVMQRWAAREAVIKLDTFADKSLTEEEKKRFLDAGARISRCPFLINDKPRTTLSKMRAEARRHKDLQLIVIDYLQLIPVIGKYERRDLEIAAITRELKLMAKELNVVIILLAQLNRMKGDTEEPDLRSLRESGSIEQDADKVLFIWKMDEFGKICVKVEKNREGKTGRVVMQFDGDIMRYTELSENYTPPKKRSKAQEVFDDD